MMFLQFAVWGAWFVVFYPYVTNKLGMTGTQAGWLIGNMALGAIFSSFFAGYLADRLMRSELLLSFCHLLGAVLLYAIAKIETQDQFPILFALALIYSLLYNPTLVMANSITFRHVPDGQRDFPGIRVFGTIGWIVAGFAVDALFKSASVDSAGKSTLIPAYMSNGPLLLASGLSAVLGVFSLVLPKTPPIAKAGDGIPMFKAFGLFRDYSFAVFFIVSLVITIALAFYYTVTPGFLPDRVKIVDVSSTMLIGQICETVFLPLLPLLLLRIGMKWVLALGMLCWALRYLLFSQAGPEGLPYLFAIVGIALHGLCFDFFFAAGFIHCDNEAPNEIKASAQALFSFLTYGVGMWLGSLLSGMLVDKYTSTATGIKTIDWTSFWLVPAGGAFACLLIFALFFRIGSKPKN